ncbi:MAG: hypothetical protein LBD58_02555 [Treponema sp.]|nr:hypothetical protein [Treponema sp.]
MKPLLAKLRLRIKRGIDAESLLRDASFRQTRVFLFSTLTLFLLAGFVIPTALIASAAQEFSFIDDYASPFPFVVNTTFQAAGVFLFWPVCFYLLFSKKVF